MGGYRGISLDAVLVVLIVLINAASIVVTKVLGSSILGLGLLSWHCIFYFTGHIAHEHISKTRKYMKFILPIGAGLWVLLVPFWRRDSSLIMNFFRGIFNNKVLYDGATICFNLIVAYCGIAFSACIVLLVQKMHFDRIINELGMYTIEIYVLQNMFFNILPVSITWVAILINICMGTFFPYAIAKVFAVGKGRKLLFGRN